MPSHFMYHSLAISIHVYVPEYHIQFYYFANLAYAVSFAWKAFIPFFFMRKSARTSHSLKSLLWHPQRMNHSIFRISSILYIPMSITALIALYGIICLHVYPFHADSSFSILTSYHLRPFITVKILYPVGYVNWAIRTNTDIIQLEQL